MPCAIALRADFTASGLRRLPALATVCEAARARRAGGRR